jgi:MFS family permease
MLMAAEAVPVAMLAYRLPIGAIVASQVAGGFAIGLFVTMWDTAIDEHVPPEKLSRVTAYDSLATLVMQPAGLLAAAPLAAVTGIKDVLLGSAVFAVASTCCYLLVPGVRTLPSARAKSQETHVSTIPQST